MSIVRIQNVMSNELSKRIFVTRPPEPPYEFLLNDPTDSIFIGITKLFGVPFTWNFANLANPHISVVGITGSGKSFFVKTFLTRASFVWNTNAIIVDWAGEYIAWVKNSGGVVVSLAKGDYMNLMDLSGTKPLDRVKQIMNAFDILTDISDFPEQRRLTAEAIEQAYLNAGFGLATLPDPRREVPTLKDVTKLLEEKLQEGTYQYPAELENTIYRLRQFSRDGEDYFAKKSTIDLGKLATSGLVDIDLSGLPDEKFRAMAALFILQTLEVIMRAEGWSSTKGLKALVVLDEAWKIANDERSDAITIIREGRKYQFGLIVASQNPTDINEAIFSNVGTTIMLKIKFEKFLDYLQGSLNFSAYIRKEIGNFGVGQAAVDMSFNTSVQFPNVFVIERIVGEVPLDTYTITIGDILTPSEQEQKTIPKDYSFERIDMSSKFVDAGFSAEAIQKIFKGMDSKGRVIDIRAMMQILSAENIDKNVMVSFLRSIGLSDTLITRVFGYLAAQM